MKKLLYLVAGVAAVMIAKEVPAMIRYAKMKQM